MYGERALEYAKRAGLNQYYLPLVEVVIGETSFPIFGSMSWTVAHVRTSQWEAVRNAYIHITGDTRDNVDVDAAVNVVAGELQKHWAEYHGRADLKVAIDEQQEKRIAFAVKDPPATPAGSPSAGKSRTERSANMAKKEKKPAAEPKPSDSVPQRGASGHAAKIIADGNHNRESVMAAVQEAFPKVKNVAPAVSYAARCLGVTLE